MEIKKADLDDVCYEEKEVLIQDPEGDFAAIFTDAEGKE